MGQLRRRQAIPRCDNCMAHCGFEGTAVNDAFSHPLKALMAALRGPRVSGPMAPELPITYSETARAGHRGRGAGGRGQAHAPRRRRTAAAESR